MLVKIILAVSAAVFLPYLLGSINFAIIIARIVLKKDIRELGSKNAGMTNVIRTVGPVCGLLTLIGDLAKAIVAVLFGKFLFGFFDFNPLYGAYIAGIACMLGHIFPLYFNFKGGKGVLTAAGLILIIDWKLLVVLLAVFILVTLITRIVSLGSIVAAASLPLSSFIFRQAKSDNIYFEVFLAALLSLTIIFMHRQNISRLLKGEEKRLKFAKKE